MELPKMLTIGELAKEFKDTGLSEYRIRQFVLSGEVPHIMAGKKYLVNLQLFVEYLNSSSSKKQICQNGIRKIDEKLK